MSNPRRLIVIVKPRPFNEAAWKRLLTAYAYALYDRKQKPTSQAKSAREEGTQ